MRKSNPAIAIQKPDIEFNAEELLILPTIATKELVGTSGDVVMLYNFLNRE